jgi:hypothetical protein
LSPEPATWRTSTFSSNGSNCVEVLELDAGAWLRDSKDRAGPALRLDAQGWRGFLDAVAGGHAGDGAVRIRAGADGGRSIEDVATGRELHFTAGEWSAFRRGVAAGEFGPRRSPA